MEYMKHSRRALAEWRRTDEERSRAWLAAMTEEDVRACQRMDKIAADAVREAFFLDTAEFNSWETIMSAEVHPLDIAAVTDVPELEP